MGKRKVVSEDYFFDDDHKKEETFFCRPRRKHITTHQCLVDFLNANAYERRRLRCYKCRIGKKVRKQFSDS